MSKSYVVRAIVTQALELEVEAKSEKEAKKKADQTDLNDWIVVEDIDFEITNIEEES
jgi:hypothetical protein